MYLGMQEAGLDFMPANQVGLCGPCDVLSGSNRSYFNQPHLTEPEPLVIPTLSPLWHGSRMLPPVCAQHIKLQMAALLRCVCVCVEGGYVCVCAWSVCVPVWCMWVCDCVLIWRMCVWCMCVGGCVWCFVCVCVYGGGVWHVCVWYMCTSRLCVERTSDLKAVCYEVCVEQCEATSCNINKRVCVFFCKLCHHRKSSCYLLTCYTAGQLQPH